MAILVVINLWQHPLVLLGCRVIMLLFPVFSPGVIKDIVSTITREVTNNQSSLIRELSSLTVRLNSLRSPFPTVNQPIALVKQAGRGCFLAKTDT